MSSFVYARVMTAISSPQQLGQIDASSEILEPLPYVPHRPHVISFTNALFHHSTVEVARNSRSLRGRSCGLSESMTPYWVSSSAVKGAGLVSTKLSSTSASESKVALPTWNVASPQPFGTGQSSSSSFPYHGNSCTGPCLFLGR